MHKDKLIAAIIILSLFPAAAVFAESITLKSGKKIEGKILEKTGQYIKVEFNGAPVYYELKYIKSIDANEAQLPAAQEGLLVKDANFYLKEALKYGSQTKFKEAEGQLKKGLRINPSDHNLQEVSKMVDELKSGAAKEEYTVYLFKGANYLMNTEYQSAITMFKKALELRPDNADLKYYLGICNYYLGQYPQAIGNLEKTLKTKTDTEIYYYLGLSHYSLSQYAQAITYLEKVLEINPDDADAYGLMGMSRYSLGDDQQARENLSKAKQLFQAQGDYLKAEEIGDFLGKLM